jgi:hypothetical protein
MIGRAIAASVTVDVSTVHRLTQPEMDPAKQFDGVLDLAPGPDGIFAVGWQSRNATEVRAIKVSPDGALAWSSDYDVRKLERPQIARPALDGSHWVAGVAYQRDVSNVHGPNWLDTLRSAQYEYLRRVAGNGTVSDRIPISPIGDNHYFECGQAVPGGFVLTGRTTAGAPWVEMLGTDGKKVWERSFPEEEDRLLESDQRLGIPHCRGLHVGGNGNITWAAKVMTNYIVQTPQGREVVRSPRSNGFWGTFVVQLDAHGHDLRRFFRPNVERPTLLPNDDGFVLLLQPHHQDQHPRADALFPDALGYQPGVDFGLTVEFLDASLHEIRSWTYKADSKATQVETAFHTAAGGWLLGICDGNDGAAGLKYLNPDGSLSDAISIDFDKSQACQRFAITEGPNSGEALIMIFNQRNGIKTMVARFKN